MGNEEATLEKKLLLRSYSNHCSVFHMHVLAVIELLFCFFTCYFVSCYLVSSPESPDVEIPVTPVPL